jgi:Uma2 family endonuclease
MASVPIKRYTVEEYLEIERAAEFKSEYISGEMFAMAGASYNHNIITLNIGAELRAALRGGPCIGMSNDMKVNVGASFFYPDVVVVCGERRFLDQHTDVLLNPTVIVEVLSPSTERYDRRYKLARYFQLPSLRELLFVAQDEYYIEHFIRNADGEWPLNVITEPDAVIHLSSLNCDLSVAMIYERVGFDAVP